jgi:hypothetical protein
MTLEHKDYITRGEFEERSYKTDRKIDNLAEIMIGEFDKVYDRFGQIDKRFEGIDLRLGNLETDMQFVKQQLILINNKLT